MNKMFLLALLLLLMHNGSGAQTAPVRELDVGDTIPDLLLPQVLNQKKGALRLSDFRGKLLLLDFWNIRCSSCIDAFPKLEALQRQFKGRLQVVLVTRDSREAVQKLLARSGVARATKLPMVVADTLLQQYFPIYTPHHAWLDGGGKVLAITHPWNATPEKVARLLKGEPVYMARMKPVVQLGESRELWKDSRFSTSTQAYSFLLPYIEGLIEGMGPLCRDSSGKVVGYYLHNRGLLDWVKIAWGGIDVQSNPFGPPGDRRKVVLLVADSSRFIQPQDDNLLDVWLEQNLFSYEVKVKQAEDLLPVMQEDLRRYFGVQARVEKRMRNALALICTGTTNRFKAQGGEMVWEADEKKARWRIRNTPVQNFLQWFPMRGITSGPPLLVNQTGYEGNLDLDLNLQGEAVSLASVREALRTQGLDLVERHVWVEVLVVEDAHGSNAGLKTNNTSTGKN